MSMAGLACAVPIQHANAIQYLMAPVWRREALQGARICNRLFRQAQPGELPARLGREKVAVSRADVAGRRGARAATQDILRTHELAVVLANRAGGRLVARVRAIVAARPLPHVAERLRERAGRR